jgi:hypothetical protein
MCEQTYVIGDTSTLLSQFGGQFEEGYWRLGDGLLGNTLDGATISDSSSRGVNGTYSDNVTSVSGAIAADNNTAVAFNGSSEYGEIPSRSFYSLTRGWDAFSDRATFCQHDSDCGGAPAYCETFYPLGSCVDPGSRSWGLAPSNDEWTAQVTQNAIYRTTLFDAVIDPQGQSGTFQQGLPNTKLLYGDMQVRGTWSVEPGTGDIVAIGLIAQREDENNMNLVELIEFDDHSMELVILEVIQGTTTPLASVTLPDANQLGDWWYVRFQFQGINLSAKAWKMGTTEPDWQVNHLADAAHLGSVAVRTANSTSDVRPVVRFDDFWVQSIGFSLSVFLKIPLSQPGQVPLDAGYASFPLGKGDKSSGTFSSGNQEYYFRYYTDENNTRWLKTYIFNPEGQLGAGQAAKDIDPSRWYHVVMEFDPGDFNDSTAGVSLYINGRYLPPSVPGALYGADCAVGQCDFATNKCSNGDSCWHITPQSAGAPLRIGTNDLKSWFNGSMDELMIVSRRLTCDEVSAVYNTSCQPTTWSLSGLFATASSERTPGEFATAAIDGSIFTSWESASGDAQWITLDLGSVRDIATARLIWGNRLPLEYKIQVSTDNINWTDAKDVTTTTTSGGIDLVAVNSTTRYVRMLGVTSVNHLGYSLTEFQVYTCGVGPVDCVNSPPVAVVGPPQLAFPQQQVTLNGSSTFDPDNLPFENPFMYIAGGDDPSQFLYHWELTTKPFGSLAGLVTDPRQPNASFVPDRYGTYVATLVVTDANGGPGSASSVPASTVITVVRPDQVATIGLSQALSIAKALTLNDVTSAAERDAMISLVTQASADLQGGKVKQALQKVDSAIVRTDGWSLRGAADTMGPGRDWIITQGPATALYSALNTADGALRAM